MPELLTINTATQFFFDKPKVQRATKNMNRRSLSKIGAFIRTRDRSSMRPAGKKGKVSRPGEPPRVRKGQLKKFLYFVYSPETESVVVGPVLLNGNVQDGQTVPNKLEFGGRIKTELVELPSGLIVPANSALGRKVNGRKFTRQNKLEPRPHTGPAFEKTKPEMPAAFRGEFNNTSGG